MKVNSLTIPFLTYAVFKPHLFWNKCVVYIIYEKSIRKNNQDICIYF